MSLLRRLASTAVVPAVATPAAVACGHIPVLGAATLDMWRRPDDDDASNAALYIDGTVGLGGHSEMLLSTSTNTRLLCVDRDNEMLDVARQRLARFGDRVAFARGSFGNLPALLRTAGLPAQVDGVLLDLGINSEQLALAERGFSFSRDGPLDMRFNRGGVQPTAAELLARLDHEELSTLFRDYGGEPRHSAAARAVLRWRGERTADAAPPTTAELADVLFRALPPRRISGKGSSRKRRMRKGTGIHPATRCFQALRIAVNDELGEVDFFLNTVLPQVLRPGGGRAAIISFHSLEDRRVKRRFKAMANGCLCPRNGTEPCFETDEEGVGGTDEEGGAAAGASGGYARSERGVAALPRTPATCQRTAVAKLLTRKAVVADDQETSENPRARSARLRAIATL